MPHHRPWQDTHPHPGLQAEAMPHRRRQDKPPHRRRAGPYKVGNTHDLLLHHEDS